MEKFDLYHNSNVNPRNRAESYIIRFIKKFLVDKVDMTIEQLREHVLSVSETYQRTHPNHGFVTIGNIHENGHIAGKPNICTRSFAIYGRGRKTYTLSISESLFKDSENNYMIADCVFNRQ